MGKPLYPTALLIHREQQVGCNLANLCDEIAYLLAIDNIAREQYHAPNLWVA
jgi:hypothetical protein